MKKQPVQVIGVGSPVVDLVAEIDDARLKSVPGKKGGMELVDADTISSLLALVENRPVKAPGGSAGNTTFALARMGMSCAFMGKVGRDENGEFYRDLFEDIGGDISRFKNHDTRPTARCLSLVTPDSERTMRTDLGAAAGFSPEDLTPEDFAGCRHAHVEGYLLFNRELLDAVLKSAKAAGCTVSLDLGSFEVVEAARDILPKVLENYVDVVFANEEEAAAFSGSNDPKAGLAALRALCDVAAVKVGKDGAWVQDGGAPCHVPAMPTDKILDTTGAGDYWAAGFLFSHLNGYPVITSARLGALLGKHVIAHYGAALNRRTWGEIIGESTILLSQKEEDLC